MTPFIDIHSHSQKQKDIKYVLVKEINTYSDQHYFINGVHPWDLETSITVEQVLKFKDHSNYIGLGEIGLDKLKPNFELQLERFKEQVEIAVDNNINFIVLHNIKSTQEILKVLKDIRFKGVILLHAFNGTKELFEQFNRYTKTYVACGKQLLKNGKLLNSLKEIPRSRIFFETDDDNLDIKAVYSSYAEHNNILIEDLKEQIADNFTKLIKDINIPY